MVHGVPNKHRRVERLRRNLQQAMADALVRKLLPRTVRELKTIYVHARDVFATKSYVEMRNVKFDTDGYPNF